MQNFINEKIGIAFSNVLEEPKKYAKLFFQLDHDGASDVCSLVSDADPGSNGSSAPRSVMSGGSVKGICSLNI